MKSLFSGFRFMRPHGLLYFPQKWFDIHPLDEIQVVRYLSDELNDFPAVGPHINDLPMMPSPEWVIESGEWKNII